MVRLAARSFSPAVCTWLSRNHQARVLHVFEQVVNLSAGDQVASLVTENVGNGPFSVVVPACDFSQHVDLSDTPTVVPNALRVGNLEIELGSAKRWNPAPDWPGLRQSCSRIRAQAPTLRRVLRTHAPASSFARLVADLPTPMRSKSDARVIECARRHWTNLLGALSSLDEAEAAASAKQLVGLGNGLTPSGDDWLVGCGLAVQLAMPAPAAALLLKAIRLNLASTTQLSSMWLQAAVDGLCSEKWHSFFAACCQPDSGQVYWAAQRIVAQGHSSGADALAGFLAIIERWDFET